MIRETLSSVIRKDNRRRKQLAAALQRFTLTYGREERFSIAVSLRLPARIVHDNK